MILLTQSSKSNHSEINGNAAAMDTDQALLSSSSVLQTYNEAICNSVNSSLATLVTRIESSLSSQYCSLLEALGNNDVRKRKTPNDLNGLNNGTPSFTPQSNATTSSLFNAQPSNELEPPEEKIKPKQFRSIFEIYVSKFKNDTTAEKIIQHVIKTSTIKNRDLFSVELLTKSRENVKKLSYVSFKITTCNEKAYEAILKEEVWEPNFKAIPFSDQKSQTKGASASEIKPKQLNSNLQTPMSMKSHRNEKSGDNPRKRQVKFNVDTQNINANQQNVTPLSSRTNRTVSSNNKTPVTNVPSGNNTYATQIHGNVLQQPAFFGIPGQTHNTMQPIYYPIHHQHQQHMFQHPQMYQQQQAPIQQQRYQHQIPHQRMQHQ